MIVAIDGTTGSGKSGLCKRVCKELNFKYIRSSSFYRAIAYKMLCNNINKDDLAQVKQLLKTTNIQYDYNNEHVVLTMDGTDVSDKLNTPEVSDYVSKIASISDVRKHVRKLQKQSAKNHKNIVMEGRDIGSVIFPNADLKIYMDCDINVRAERRVKQYAKNGIKVSLQKAKQAIAQRDLEDTTRHDSPLIRLPEAFYLDTTNLSMEECVNIVIQQIKLKQNKK